jgi:hypothetical protein
MIHLGTGSYLLHLLFDRDDPTTPSATEHVNLFPEIGVGLGSLARVQLADQIPTFRLRRCILPHMTAIRCHMYYLPSTY